MRHKVHWFRPQARKSPAEVAGALALVLWACARRMLNALRKAGFDIDPGPAFFAFLAEALAFEIQVAWRVAHELYGETDREAFIQALARDVARIFAENRAELLGGAAGEIERRFVDEVNRRFEEYADFVHGSEGPSFAFLRYFASLVHDIVPQKDRAWIHDELIAIEGPEAAGAVAKALAALLDTGPQRLRRAAPASVGE